MDLLNENNQMILEEFCNTLHKWESIRNGAESVRGRSNSIHNIFPWVSRFNKILLGFSGNMNIKDLEFLVLMFGREVKKSMKNCYNNPNNATKLKSVVNQTLTFFNFIYQDFKSGQLSTKYIPGKGVYLSLMSEIVAIYIDLEIEASKQGVESLKKISYTITSALFLFLDHSENHIADAVLRTKLMNSASKELCAPVLSKFLKEAKCIISHEYDYLRFVFSFKLWMEMETNSKERGRISRIADSKLNPPPHILEKVKSMKNVIPNIPETCKNLTFILMNGNLDFIKSKMKFVTILSTKSKAKYLNLDRDVEFCKSFDSNSKSIDCSESEKCKSDLAVLFKSNRSNDGKQFLETVSEERGGNSLKIEECQKRGPAKRPDYQFNKRFKTDLNSSWEEEVKSHKAPGNCANFEISATAFNIVDDNRVNDGFNKTTLRGISNSNISEEKHVYKEDINGGASIGNLNETGNFFEDFKELYEEYQNAKNEIKHAGTTSSDFVSSQDPSQQNLNESFDSFDQTNLCSGEKSFGLQDSFDLNSEFIELGVEKPDDEKNTHDDSNCFMKEKCPGEIYTQTYQTVDPDLEQFPCVNDFANDKFLVDDFNFFETNCDLDNLDNIDQSNLIFGHNYSTENFCDGLGSLGEDQSTVDFFQIISGRVCGVVHRGDYSRLNFVFQTIFTNIVEHSFKSFSFVGIPFKVGWILRTTSTSRFWIQGLWTRGLLRIHILSDRG